MWRDFLGLVDAILHIHPIRSLPFLSPISL